MAQPGVAAVERTLIDLDTYVPRAPALPLPRQPMRVRHPWVWAASQTFAGAVIFVVMFTLTLYGLQEVLSWSD